MRNERAKVTRSARDVEHDSTGKSRLRGSHSTFSKTFREKLLEFSIPVLGVASALIALVVVVLILRGLGYSGPIDPLAFLEVMGRHPEPEKLNIQCRLKDGSVLKPPKLVCVKAHNGVGKEYQLEG